MLFHPRSCYSNAAAVAVAADCLAIHILRRSDLRKRHTQVLTYDKAHTSTTQLFPSVARTAELVASQPGIWQYNCDVQDHLVAGVNPYCTPAVCKPDAMLRHMLRCMRATCLMVVLLC